MSTTTVKLRRVAKEAAELPVLRLLAAPLYQRRFNRPYRAGALSFCGVYESHAQALAAAPKAVPTSFDTAASGKPHDPNVTMIRVSDYPVVYWLSRLLSPDCRRLFDLGGQTGLSYFRLRRFLQYPAGMQWLVHDVPAVVAFGSAWAKENDPHGQLAFTDDLEEAEGSDVMLISGALQYLEYTLFDLLGELDHAPPHVLVNLTPLHPSRSFFTLENIGHAICPYRVMAVAEFITGMEAAGYVMQDHWETLERRMRIPFVPECSIDRYHGFYFRRTPSASAT